jgi:hypothetical protein
VSRRDVNLACAVMRMRRRHLRHMDEPMPSQGVVLTSSGGESIEIENVEDVIRKNLNRRAVTSTVRYR